MKRRSRTHHTLLAATLAGALIAGALARAAPAAGPALQSAEAPAAAARAGAGQASYVAGEVLVRFRGQRRQVAREIPLSADPARVARRLARRKDVVHAAPNHIARAAGRMIPNDPGSSGRPGGWTEDQWNFLGGPGGIALPPAWDALRDAGIPGGGRPGRRPEPIVAVLDTGIAYRRGGPLDRSPDFLPRQFVRGRDVVDRDPLPHDENGHGTHIAGTIGEQVDNAVAVTGIAYGVRLMPVRVLDGQGTGKADDIARGILWAVRKGADLINLSLEFSQGVSSCADIPGVCEAIARARSRRVMVVAAAGNGGLDEIGDGRVSMPAQAAFAVGATTLRGCLARYSNWGQGLDLVAPGGGEDAVLSDPRCAPLSAENPEIVQLSFESVDDSEFALIPRHGTSMASAHVTGVAALVLATRQLHHRGRRPVVGRLERHLLGTARPLGDPDRYGAGLLSARRAVSASWPPAL